MHATLTAEEAVRDFEALLDDISAHRGETVITRHGQPVARIIPFGPSGLPLDSKVEAYLQFMKNWTSEVCPEEREDFACDIEAARANGNQPVVGMGLVIDTCVFAAAERGKLDLAKFRIDHRSEAASMSVITLAELLYGLHRANTPERHGRRLAFIGQQRDVFPVIPFGQAEAEYHAALTSTLNAKGLQIGPYDSLIAATALAQGLRVATLNISEFLRVPGLKMVDASAWLVQ